MLYFAYGMNTNPEEMAIRCADSQCLGSAVLLAHCFRFAVHADVLPCEGSDVQGVLWSVTQRDLEALDALEGYPVYYNRSELAIAWQNKVVYAQVYRMQPGIPEQAPSSRYFNLIKSGYIANGVPMEQLYNSLLQSTGQMVSAH